MGFGVKSETGISEKTSLRRGPLNKDWKEMRRNDANMWKKTVPGSRNRRCKGPEARLCLVYLKHSREADVIGVNEQE